MWERLASNGMTVGGAPSPSPCGRSGAALVAMGESLLLHGGMTDGQLPLSDSWLFAPNSKTWSKLVHSTKLEGVNDPDPTKCHHESHESLYKTLRDNDPFLFSDSKISKELPGPSARHGHSMVYVNNVVHLFGGEEPVECQYFGDTFVLKEGSTRWLRSAPLGDIPSPRAFHAAGVIDESKYFVFGGESGNFQLNNDFHLFTDTTFEWLPLRTVSLRPPPRKMCISAIYKPGRVVIIGGRGHDSYLNDMWVFDINRNAWAPIQPRTATLPPADELAGGFPIVCAHGLLIWISSSNKCARSHSTGRSQAWLFDFNSHSWSSQILPDPFPASRLQSSHTYDITSGTVHTFGGSRENRLLNDLWRWNPS